MKLDRFLERRGLPGHGGGPGVRYSFVTASGAVVSAELRPSSGAALVLDLLSEEDRDRHLHDIARFLIESLEVPKVRARVALSRLDLPRSEEEPSDTSYEQLLERLVIGHEQVSAAELETLAARHPELASIVVDFLGEL